MKKSIFLTFLIIVLLIAGILSILFYLSHSRLSGWEATISQLDSESIVQTARLELAISSRFLSSEEAAEISGSMTNLISQLGDVSRDMTKTTLPSLMHANRFILLKDQVSMQEDKVSMLNKAIRDALSNSGRHIDALKQLKTDIDKHKSKYRATLSARSDIEDFKNMAATIQKMRELLSEKRIKLNAVMTAVELGDLKDTLEVLILQSESKFIEETFVILKTQEDNVIILSEALHDYKTSVRGDLCNNQHLLQNISNITSSYLPLIRSVNAKIDPLNSVLRELNRPIQGTEGLSSMNIAGYGLGSSITPLSLLRSIDPATGTLINHISTFCQGLAVLESEFQQASEATSNYSIALASARSNTSREEMLSLVIKSGELRTHLESKKGILRPFVSELDKVGNEIRRIDNVARRVQAPQARSYLLSFTSNAQQILNLAYTPFNRWESLVDNLNQPLLSLQQKESAYLDLLSIASLNTLEGSELVQSFKQLAQSRPQTSTFASDTRNRGTTINTNVNSRATGSSNVITEYTARLSHKDHYNSSGAFLSHAPAIIQQDRANYHRFNNPDPEDEPDAFFTTLERRSLITTNPNAMNIPSHIADRIIHGTPLVRVKKFDNGRIEIELLD